MMATVVADSRACGEIGWMFAMQWIKGPGKVPGVCDSDDGKIVIGTHK